MNKIYLFKLLKIYKYRFTRQQYLTIKGQIKAGDYGGAMKGIKKIIWTNY